jgi:hypothetical protein
VYDGETVFAEHLAEGSLHSFLMKRRPTFKDLRSTIRIEVERKDPLLLRSEGDGGRQANGPQADDRQARHIAS